MLHHQHYQRTRPLSAIANLLQCQLIEKVFASIMNKPFVYIWRAGGAMTIESPQFIMTDDDAFCGSIVSECEKLSMLIRDCKR